MVIKGLPLMIFTWFFVLAWELKNQHLHSLSRWLNKVNGLEEKRKKKLRPHQIVPLLLEPHTRSIAVQCCSWFFFFPRVSGVVKKRTLPFPVIVIVGRWLQEQSATSLARATTTTSVSCVEKLENVVMRVDYSCVLTQFKT